MVMGSRCDAPIAAVRLDLGREVGGTTTSTRPLPEENSMSSLPVSWSIETRMSPLPDKGVDRPVDRPVVRRHFRTVRRRAAADPPDLAVA
jgi:hypothetical protein